jgi:hypothetical protein
MRAGATPTLHVDHHLPDQFAAIARILEGRWKRRVVVPGKLYKRKIQRRTLSGTPEEVAEALGFELGPKRRRRA